jgi:hypothetical protein
MKSYRFWKSARAVIIGYLMRRPAGFAAVISTLAMDG